MSRAMEVLRELVKLHDRERLALYAQHGITLEHPTWSEARALIAKGETTQEAIPESWQVDGGGVVPAPSPSPRDEVIEECIHALVNLQSSSIDVAIHTLSALKSHPSGER